MKNYILPILLILNLASYGQAKLKYAVDSTRFFNRDTAKGSTLIIENNTKRLNGGFLKNVYNGITKFAYAVDTFYSSSDTLFYRRGDGVRGIKLVGGGTNQTVTLSGDISGTGTTAITTTLPTINSNVGTFNNLTVNGKGQVTAASNVAYYLASNPNGYLSNITGHVTAGTNVTITGTGTIASPYVINSATSGAGGGTVTAVTFPTAPAWLTGSVATGTTTPAISLTPTAGQLANQFLATPNGAVGPVGLRSIVAADVPTLNQNTTGTASTITGSVTQGQVTNLATTLAAKQNVLTLTTAGSGAATLLRDTLNIPTPTAAGTGTVTSVSVATANGVSGTVATPTTTPAITLTLGAITPTSVAATGTVTGSNLSGTNTGNVTLTTTGTTGAATLTGQSLNIPNYSNGAFTWSGITYGSAFSSSNSTMDGTAIQWTFTGTLPSTYTLPTFSASQHLNRMYFIKNAGTANLTISRSGTDNIYTTATVASFVLAPGESVIVSNSATPGFPSLWIAYQQSPNYPVTSIFGRTGSVVSATGDYTTAQVTEATNLYYTDARSRAAISLTQNAGATSYAPTTGVLNIPPNTANLVSNGISRDGDSIILGGSATRNTTIYDPLVARTFEIGSPTLGPFNLVSFRGRQGWLSGNGGHFQSLDYDLPPGITYTGSGNGVTQGYPGALFISGSDTLDLYGKKAVGVSSSILKYSTWAGSSTDTSTNNRTSLLTVHRNTGNITVGRRFNAQSGVNSNYEFPTEYKSSVFTVIAPSDRKYSRGSIPWPLLKMSSRDSIPNPDIGLVVYQTDNTPGVYLFNGTTWSLLGSGGTGSGNALTTNPLSQFAATTSAQLAGVITDETGTGSAVLATSPILVTPNLGTPSALVGTNITGTAAGLTAGTVTTNANLTGDVTSVGNATTIPTNSIGFTKLAQIGTGNFLGRITAGVGSIETFSTAQAKTQLAINNVDNTSDVNKPVSTAQQNALNAKENSLGNPTIDGNVLSSTIAGVRSWVAGGSSVTPSSTTTFTNKTIAGDVNTFSNIPAAAIRTTDTETLGRFTTTADGLVPLSTTTNTTDFLRRDGTWAAPAGGGFTGTTANDIEITDATKGIIQRSPNGTRYRGTISDGGVYTWTSLTPPPAPAQNFLLYSEELERTTHWTYDAGGTMAANTTTAPDGTTTAETRTAGTPAYSGLVRYAPAYNFLNQQYTLSFYVKRVTHDWIGIRMAGSSNGTDTYGFVNLFTLAVDTKGYAGVTMGIESAANGWYRIWQTFTPAAGVAVVDISITSNSGAVFNTYAGTEQMYIWGAQLNAGALKPYGKTTTATIP